MRFCLVVCLLLTFPAWAEPRFGTEIELKNRMHHVTEICAQTGLAAFPLMLGGAVASIMIEKDTNRKQNWQRFTLAAGGTVVLCLGQVVVDIVNNEMALARLKAALKARIESGELTIDRGKRGDSKDAFGTPLRVTYRDGSEIHFSADFATIEVKMPGTTAAQFRERIPFLDRELFGLCATIGLKAPSIDGLYNAGHLHVDVETAFEGDPRKLKRFLLDTWKHQAIFRGPLGDVGRDAHGVTREADLRNIESVVAYLDSLADRGVRLELGHLRYLRNVYPGLFYKGHLISINPEFGTLELRGFRSQKNATELALVTELLTHRIAFTNAQPEAPFKASDIPLKWGGPEETGPLFRDWVESMGQKFDTYLPLLPKRIRRAIDDCRDTAAALGRSG